MNEQERIAEKIFSKYGLEFKTAIRAGGWTNAVWLNGDLALRLSFKKGSDRIRREVRLSEYLPDVIGYPANIDVGLMDGYEWSLSKRIYGNNLSEIWSSLSWHKRTEAVRQILRVMDILHTVDINKVKRIPNKKAWYSSFNTEETYELLKKYKQLKIFTTKQIDVFYDILEPFWVRHAAATHVLNHGDITMDNLLWSDGRIISLMDFEHSVIAPSEFDLHSLINLAFFTNDKDCLSNVSNQGFHKYKNDIIDLLKPRLDNNYSVDLILGYAILYRIRFLEMWLENPKGKLEKLDVYIKLLSLTNGEGGYLSEIIYSQI